MIFKGHSFRVSRQEAPRVLVGAGRYSTEGIEGPAGIRECVRGTAGTSGEYQTALVFALLIAHKLRC